jgi:hypothetical protein
MPNADQLDLFGGLSETGPAADTQTPTPGACPADLRVGSGLPCVPVQRPPALPPEVRWREVDTPSQTIGYMLRRSRRRSIGLTINDDGLLVAAPAWVTLTQIDSVVCEKHAWILRKLHQRRERQAQLATADTQWQHGGRIPYLGKRIVLHLGNRQAAAVFNGKLHAPDEGDLLLLPLPEDADQIRVRDGTHAWLQQQARHWFEQRTQWFLEREGLQIKRLRLSAASTRWGSCSSDGSIMLNWRLIHFEPGIIDYVIAHEIAHLREMNHSSAFWRELGRILPGFEQARNALRQHRPDSLPLL